jgi:lipoprotein NlpD
MKTLRMRKRFFGILISCCMLAACASYQAQAPVQDVNVHNVNGALMHTVQPGETLYEVAWRYDKDYRDLATINRIAPPYAIHPGEQIQLNGKAIARPVAQQSVFAPSAQSAVQRGPSVFAPQHKKTPPVSLKVDRREPTGSVKRWHWPLYKRIAGNVQSVEKGIDIAGVYQQSVLAAANGKVVYAGNGVRGYGYLILLKHNAQYLTTYAYNNQLLVQEGDWVKAGQPIARMGKMDSGKAMLHFEIRKAGRAVNPLVYF